jgi:Arc/MetJ family transcription regulator
MKTTVDIPEDLLLEVMRSSGATTKKSAIIAALEEYRRRRRLARLADRLGTFERFMSRKDLDRLRADERPGR